MRRNTASEISSHARSTYDNEQDVKDIGRLLYSLVQAAERKSDLDTFIEDAFDESHLSALRPEIDTAGPPPCGSPSSLSASLASMAPDTEQQQGGGADASAMGQSAGSGDGAYGGDVEPLLFSLYHSANFDPARGSADGELIPAADSRMDLPQIISHKARAAGTAADGVDQLELEEGLHWSAEYENVNLSPSSAALDHDPDSDSDYDFAVANSDDAHQHCPACALHTDDKTAKPTEKRIVYGDEDAEGRPYLRLFCADKHTRVVDMINSMYETDQSAASRGELANKLRSFGGLVAAMAQSGTEGSLMALRTAVSCVEDPAFTEGAKTIAQNVGLGGMKVASLGLRLAGSLTQKAFGDSSGGAQSKPPTLSKEWATAEGRRLLGES
jgi:hypothetical protein